MLNVKRKLYSYSMSDKTIYYLASGVGGTVGSFLPELWHAGFFSAWSILLTFVGGIVGIWLAYKVLHS